MSTTDVVIGVSGLGVMLLALLVFAVRVNADHTVSIGNAPASADDDEGSDIPTADGEPRAVEDGVRYRLMLPIHTGSGSPMEILAGLREMHVVNDGE